MQQKGLSKRIKESEFITNIFTLLSTTTLSQVIPVLIYPILSRLYTPDEFGILALFLSFVGIGTIIATGQYEFAILLPKEDKDSINLLSLVILLTFFICIISFILTLLLPNTIASLFNAPKIRPFLILIAPVLLLASVSQALEYWFNRFKKYKQIGSKRLIYSGITDSCKVALFRIKPSGCGLILGTLVGYFASTSYYIAITFKQLQTFWHSINKKTMLKQAKEYNMFPKYSLLHALTNNLSGCLPIFLLTRFFSSTIAGLYSLSYSLIFRIISLISESISQVLSQKLVYNFNHNLPIYVLVKKIIYRLFLLGFFPYVFLVIFSPWIFLYIFGKEWYEAGKYFQILSPWLFLVFISAPFSFIPNIFKKQKEALILDIMYFLLRLGALTLGIIKSNINLTIMLYSFVSTLVLITKLTWYVILARKNDIHVLHISR